MIRGGSWNNSARNCRAAYRNRNRPDNRNRNQGFRVCLFFGTKTVRRGDRHRTTHVPEPLMEFVSNEVIGHNLGKPLTGVDIFQGDAR